MGDAHIGQGEVHKRRKGRSFATGRKQTTASLPDAQAGLSSSSTAWASRMPMDTMRSFCRRRVGRRAAVMPEPPGQREGGPNPRPAAVRGSYPTPRHRSLELYRITTPPFLLAEGTTRIARGLSTPFLFGFGHHGRHDRRHLGHGSSGFSALALSVPPRVSSPWYLRGSATTCGGCCPQWQRRLVVLPGSWLPTLAVER